MGLVNASGNDVNGTVNGGCNNDVAGALGAALQKGTPVQGGAGSDGATSSDNHINTQDDRSCTTSGTSAGNGSGDSSGGGAGGTSGSNSTDHTSMGLVNASGNNVNGTANALCNNDVAGALGAAAQKGVPVQGSADSDGATSATNNLTTDDGRSCAAGNTSAGDSAGGGSGTSPAGSGSEGGSDSVDHTSMGLVNASGNDVNGTVNGGCNNDVAAGGVAAQKGIPAQAALGALAPVISNYTDNTQDGRDCTTSGTSAGNTAGGGSGATSGTEGSNSVDHTSMGLVNASGNDVNGTANALCSNDVAAGGVAAQKGVPVQGVAGSDQNSPTSATNNLTTKDGRTCAVTDTSAGNTAH